MAILPWVDNETVTVFAVCFEVQDPSSFQRCHGPANKRPIYDSPNTVREGFFFIIRFIVQMHNIRHKITHLDKIGLIRIFFEDIFYQVIDRLVLIPKGKF